MWPFLPLAPGKAAALRDVGARDPHARVRALQALANAAHDDVDYRAQAVIAAERALQDPVAGVRSAACVALADLGCGSAQSSMLLMLDDAHGHVRQMALSALGEVGDSRAIARIARLLADPRPEMRYQSLLAFVRLETDNRERLRVIALGLGDADADLRYIAARLLEEHCRGLCSIDAPRVQALAVQAFADADVAVALAAAFTAARGGHATARDAVLKVTDVGTLRGQAVPKEDEAFAVELVGELGLIAAIPHLRRRAFGLARRVRDTCAMHATIALARLGQPDGIQAILAALRSADPEMRSRAIVMAGRGIRRVDCPQIDAELARLQGLVPAAILAEALELLNAQTSVRAAAPMGRGGTVTP